MHPLLLALALDGVRRGFASIHLIHSFIPSFQSILFLIHSFIHSFIQSLHVIPFLHSLFLSSHFMSCHSILVHHSAFIHAFSSSFISFIISFHSLHFTAFQCCVSFMSFMYSFLPPSQPSFLPSFIPSFIHCFIHTHLHTCRPAYTLHFCLLAYYSIPQMRNNDADMV